MKRGEIWLTEIPSSGGHEQYGFRPVIIIQTTKTNVITIIPLTTNEKSGRFPFTLEIIPSKKNNLIKKSMALVFQLRGIDKNKLKRKIGELNENENSKILELIKEYFFSENSIINQQRLEKYNKLTSTALEKVKKSIIKGKEKEAKEIIDMVTNYLSDAKYFQTKGDYVNSFAALNYAHGWLDSGVRLGIFNVKDSKLFTVK